MSKKTTKYRDKNDLFLKNKFISNFMNTQIRLIKIKIFYLEKYLNVHVKQLARDEVIKKRSFYDGRHPQGSLESKEEGKQ